MSRSFWNDGVGRRCDGDIQDGDCVEENQTHFPRRYYPSPSYYYPVDSANEAVKATKLGYKTHQTIENKNALCSTVLTKKFSPVPFQAFPRSSFEASYPSVASASNPEASCCPLCGFQVLEASNVSCKIGPGSEFHMADAPISATASRLQIGKGQERIHGESSTSVWLRSFVINQQEHLLNGCNPTDSSALHATAGLSVPFRMGTDDIILPAGTCWVCFQAANEAAKERQVEEDRMLATSLSNIILEEQQNRSADFHTPPPPLYHNRINTARGEMNQNTSQADENFASSDNYGPHHSAIDGHRERGTLQREEWPEERRVLTHTSLLSAVVERRLEEETNQNQNCHERNTNQGSNFQFGKSDVTVNDDACVYIGDYNILGERHGSRGELIWDNGDRYVGTFKNGMRSGQGAFFFRDGSEYTGDWKEDLMHGFGQCNFANGDTYVGQYVKGQRSGGSNCKYKFSNSDLYVGGWEADQFNGFGRYFFANGSVLEGKFIKGVKQGKFKRQLPNEDLDILRFEEDKLVGQGVRWNTKRTKTWLLEPQIENGNVCASSNASKSKKKTCRRTARRMVRSIGNLARLPERGCRQKKSADYFPSSVGVSDALTWRNNDGSHTNRASSSPSVSLASSRLSASRQETLAPVLPLESMKHIVKKSVRIPISRAVSIGYDCEIGTGT